MKKTHIKCMALAIAALLAAPAACKAAGTTGAVFLNVGVSAKAEGMGGAGAAVVDDASAVTINPAAMVAVEGRQVSVMHNEYLLDINQEYAAYVSNWGKRAIGGSIVYLDYGEQSEYDNLNNYIGSFRPVDYALTAAYSAQHDESISWGVGLKYIKVKISDFSDSGFAIDAGIKYKPTPKGWTFAAVLRNLGDSIKLDENEDELPMTLVLATAYEFDKYPLVAAFDHFMINGEDPEYHLGLQYTINDMIALRTGYNSGYDIDDGFTFGVGLKYEDFGFDYAFIPSGEFGDAHRFSLNLKF